MEANMDTNKNLFGALLKAQAQMGQLVPDSTNLHLRNKYASLAAVLNVARKPLADNGLVLYQAATITDGAVIVTSTLVHPESGEMVQEMLPIPLDKMTAQAIGTGITYARRYLALAMCGLAPDDDDDGNTASNVGQRQQQAAPQRQPQPAHRPAATKPAPEPPQFHDEGLAAEPDFGMGEKTAEPNPFNDAQTNGKQAGGLGMTDHQRKLLHVLGTAAYNGIWEAKRHELVKAITKGRSESSNDLGGKEAAQIIKGVETKLRERYFALLAEAGDGAQAVDVDELTGFDLANAVKALQPVAA